MVFAAVPDDVTIEKLTGPEKRALDEYLGRETRKSIFERIAGNEQMPALLLGGALLASLPVILPLILAALKKQVPQIPEDVEEAIDTVTFVKDLNEAVGEIIFPGIGPIVFKGEARDFYDKYVKR
jgi:hypothetical protein